MVSLNQKSKQDFAVILVVRIGDSEVLNKFGSTNLSFGVPLETELMVKGGF